MGADHEVTVGEVRAHLAVEADWASMEVSEGKFPAIEVFVTTPAYGASLEQEPAYLVAISQAGGGPSIAAIRIDATTLALLGIETL